MLANAVHAILLFWMYNINYTVHYTPNPGYCYRKRYVPQNFFLVFEDTGDGAVVRLSIDVAYAR
jgi:hypothetical protein